MANGLASAKFRQYPMLFWGADWMLRVAAAFLAVAPLMGCHGIYEPGIEQCENDLLGDLKAPTTYRRVKAETLIFDADMVRSINQAAKKDGTVEANLDPASGYLSVNIEYDASNPLGVPIRDTRECKFALVNGKPDYSHVIDH
ncbi:hypothetical protein WBP07_12875 [Novosphingobium sp. BL-8A]|uniref:hypothetical protein n=1 Tax=Novosphingobium sp. BL-8A TaxID=3127639 RepID=UPI003756AD5A